MPEGSPGRPKILPAALMASLALGGGCGSPRPGPPPLFGDAGGLGDGPVFLPDGDMNVAPRDGNVVLPPADEEVVLAFGDEATIDLEVRTEPGRIDVHLSIDTTGSFGEEIDEVQSGLERVLVPALRARFRDVAFGVSEFEDFPEDPFGDLGDLPFTLHTPVSTDRARVATGVASLDDPLGAGGDIAESGLEALYQIATGEGYRRGTVTYVPAFSPSARRAEGTIGGVGFREESLRAIVHVTDAPSHVPSDYGSTFPGTHDEDDVIAALQAIDAHLVGIASGEAARPHLERVALATGASVPPIAGACATGVGGTDRDPVLGTCPLVFDVRADGSGLSTTIADAIADLVQSIRYDEVYGAAADDRLGFVRTVEALEATPQGGGTVATSDLRPADGIDDTFLDVPTETVLVLRAHLRNVSIAPADYEQTFRIVLRVLGDGQELATTTVRVVVPIGSGTPDAGVPDAAIDGSVDGG